MFKKAVAEGDVFAEEVSTQPTTWPTACSSRDKPQAADKRAAERESVAGREMAPALRRPFRAPPRPQAKAMVLRANLLSKSFLSHPASRVDLARPGFPSNQRCVCARGCAAHSARACVSVCFASSFVLVAGA